MPARVLGPPVWEQSRFVDLCDELQWQNAHLPGIIGSSPPLAVEIRLETRSSSVRTAANLASANERRHVMATFAVIAEHPPDLCPTSNAQTRQILKEGANQIPQLAEQLGVDIGTLRIFGPDHIILAVVEADDIDSVRTFALQSRLMQWNTVKIHATYSLEEAVVLIDEVEAIF
jgi:hypothetical protein